MNSKCEICGGEFWKERVGNIYRVVTPLACDERFCEDCAIEACEKMLIEDEEEGEE